MVKRRYRRGVQIFYSKQVHFSLHVLPAQKQEVVPHLDFYFILWTNFDDGFQLYFHRFHAMYR